VVVLLHGFPQTSASWDDVAPLLHAAGYRTLAPDQRGYSPGARPRGRWAYRQSELVGDVVGLLNAAEVDRAHVVGHDWGGGVAWHLAIVHPERVRTLATISAPHPAAFTRAMRSSSQLLRSWYMFATLSVWSSGDRFVSRAAAEGTERYVDGPYRFEVIEGADHWLPDNRAEQIVELLLPHLRQ
jgi:pimeloyl-ACP methyl ester carboxylesterase